MKYATAREAYDLLKDVPADKFIKGVSTNLKDKCCAAGHINRLLSKDPSDYSKKNCDAYAHDKPAYALVYNLVSANDSYSGDSKENSLTYLKSVMKPKSLWRQIIDSFK